jgi:hypothetical protein
MEGENELLLYSPNCEIRVVLDLGHQVAINALLSPPLAPPQARVGLGVILDAMNDPAIAFAPRSIMTLAELNHECERIARLIALHCRPLLHGEFGSWKQLLDEIEAGAAGYARGGAAREEWVLRQRAFVAFGQESYAAAVQAYSALGNLSDRERKKLEYARRQLESGGG